MTACARVSITSAVLLCALSGVAQNAPVTPDQLLDHLPGRWVMSGTIDGKQTTHDVDADWVLKREYIRLHEVSREKDATGGAAYDAIVFLSWDAKRGEYSCMWLDNTAGGALSAEGIAHGKPQPNAIPLVFIVKGKEALHTTFAYTAQSDSWRLTIDDVEKHERFADLRLTRSQAK